MAFFLYLIFRVISDPSLGGDITPLACVLVASDHAAFIGVVTNLVLAAGLALSADRRSSGPGPSRWPSGAQTLAC